MASLRSTCCVLVLFAVGAHAEAAERQWRAAVRADLPPAADPEQPRPTIVADAAIAAATRPPAQRAYIDPATGTLVSEPVVAPEPLEADTLQAPLPTDEFALRTTPEGWIYIRTESLRHYATAHLHADGSLGIACSDHPPEAAAAETQP